MESDEKLRNLLKFAPEIILMKPEAHIVVIPEKTTIVPKEEDQMGIDIFPRSHLKMGNSDGFQTYE